MRLCIMITVEKANNYPSDFDGIDLKEVVASMTNAEYEDDDDIMIDYEELDEDEWSGDDE